MLLALHLDDAHPAGAEAGQLGLVAEGRDLDAVVAADLEDRLALEALDDAAVNLDPDARRRRAGAAATACRAGARRAQARRVVVSGRTARSVIGGSLRSPGPRRPPRSGGRRRPGRRCGGCDRRARSGSIASLLANGRVVRRSWSHSADSTTSWLRSTSRFMSVGRGRPLVKRSPISTIRRSRCGTGSSCRMPRRRRTTSAVGPDRRRMPVRPRRRWSPTPRGRRPRAAARSRTAYRARSPAAARPMDPPTSTAFS